MTHRKTVLVVGGSGFLGRHLVMRLAGEGHDVRIADLRQPPWRPNSVSYVGPGLGSDEVLDQAVAGCDMIVHLASSTIPKTSNDDPIADVATNLLGSMRLFDAAVRHKVKRVVFSSSGGTVYGEPKCEVVSEAHPTDPTSSYGIVKLAIEKYLALYYRLYGLEYAVLRIANLYGEYQSPTSGLGAIAAFCARAHSGEPIEIWGDGSVSRDFIYVGDVIDAFIKALDSTTVTALTANLGSARSLSLNEILDTIEAILGRPLSRTYLPGRAFDVQRTCLDNTLARSALDWEPQTPIHEGIKRVLASYNEMRI